MPVILRNGPHDLGGMEGLGSIPIESNEEAQQESWGRRTISATLAAVVPGMLSPPTHRAIMQAVHPVAYMSMSHYELWLYALEQQAVASGVLTQDEIETRVATVLANPSTPMPQDRNPVIIAGVRDLLSQGAPLGPETLEKPPRFVPGDLVRTKRIPARQDELSHTRLPGYAQQRVGVVAEVRRPMVLEDVVVAAGEVQFEHVYALRLQARDIWPDADRGNSVIIDVWESYLEEETRSVNHLFEEEL
ncbi:MAG: SH3-like domain-containing protein [Mycobacterium sp.]